MTQVIDLIRKMMYILNRPQKILCIFVLGVTCLGSLLECLGVSAIIPVVNVILNPDDFLNSEIVHMVPSLNDISYEKLVVLVIGVTIIIYLFKNAFFIFLSWCRIKFACKIQREVAVRMMESYMSRGYQFFLNHSYGELSRGVSGDASAINTTIYAIFKIISDLITIVLLCAFMFITDWSLSLAMVCVSVICIVLIYFIFRKKMSVAGTEYRKYIAKANQAVVQAIQGVKDVLVLRKQKYYICEYEKNQIMVQVAQCRQTVGAESPAYVIEGLCVSGLMLVVGIKTLYSNTASAAFIADLAAFALAAFRILPSLGRISSSINQVITYLPSITSVFNNMHEAEAFAKEHPELKVFEDERHEIIARERKNKIEKLAKGEETTKHKFNRDIKLDGVSFRYDDNQENIIEDLNLEIKKGQSVAFIGASGAGKSTLVDILLGLLIPQKGAVYMDGKKITDNPDLWAKTVGYVPQSVFLSSGSVLENIAFGESVEEVDEEMAWGVLERAELADFVRSLPDGIHTLVGDQGVRLSGGQRQRIAIARALYHKPDIMVLDEATSALDNDTEAAIMSAIDALQGHVSLIIVAHRLTTVKKCDVIYEVVDKGVKVRDKKEIFNE